MENASKALLIATGALLAIALLSLMVYLFSNMAYFSSNIHQGYDDVDISEYNQKFLNYEAKNDLMIQDVITIVNIAKDNNERENLPVETKVYFTSDGYSDVNLVEKDTSYLTNLLSSEYGKRYTCTNININKTTGLVEYVYIVKN